MFDYIDARASHRKILMVATGSPISYWQFLLTELLLSACCTKKLLIYFIYFEISSSFQFYHLNTFIVSYYR